MNCALCDRSAGSGDRCANCGAKLDAALHERVGKIDYTARRLFDWHRRNVVDGPLYQRLRDELTEERAGLARTLLPPPVVVEAPAPPPPPPPPPKPPSIVILREIEPPPPAPLPPPKPPRTFAEVVRDLGSEQNIRWLLNIGVFLFTLALAVFIWTRWDDLGSTLKLAVLFGGTIAAVVLGHVLRGTVVDVTAHGLTILGTVALPLDFLALTKFPALARYGTDVIGLAASFACLVTYSRLGHLYRERAFSHLTMLAATGVWCFGLDVAGVGWGRILTTLPLVFTALYLVYAALARREGVDGDVRTLWLEPMFVFLHSAMAGATAAILVVLLYGLLTVSGDVAPLVAAAFGGFAFHYGAAWRLRRSEIAWGSILYLLAGCAELVHGGGRAAADAGLPWVFVGLVLLTPFGASTGRFVAPILGAGLTAAFAGLLILVQFQQWQNLATAFLACGVFGIGAALARRETWPLVPGYGFIAAAIVTIDHQLGLPMGDLALHLATFAAAAGLAAATRRPLVAEPSFWFAVLGAGASTLLFAGDVMALWYHAPLRGAAIAGLCALAMWGATRVERRRLLGDLMYLCVTGAYCLGLKAAGFNADWMGVAVALLAAGFFAASRTGKLLVPTMFLTLSISTCCVIYAAVLYLTGCPLEAACTGGVVALYLGVAAVATEHKFLAHPAVYLATLSLAAFLDWRGVPASSIAFASLVPVAAGIALGGAFETAGFIASAVVAAWMASTGASHALFAPMLAILCLARPRNLVTLLAACAGVAYASSIYGAGHVRDAGIALLALSAVFARAGGRTDFKLLLHPAVYVFGLGFLALLESAGLRPHVVAIATLAPAAILLALARLRREEGRVVESAVMIAMTLLTLAQASERYERSAVAYFGLGLAAILAAHALTAAQPWRLLPAGALIVLAGNLGAFVSSPGLTAAIFAALALYALLEGRHIPACGAAAVGFACASAWFATVLGRVPTLSACAWIAPVPALAALAAHRWRRPWILGAAAAAAAGLAIGWLGQPHVWDAPNQWPSAATCAIFAATSLLIAYRRPWVPASVPVAFGATFVMLAYLVGLDGLSRGLRWDGLVVMAGAIAIVGWAYAHERRHEPNFSNPILVVGFILSLIAIGVAMQDKPRFETVRPYVLFVAAALYLGVAIGWRRAPVTILSAVAIAAGDVLLIGLVGFHTRWASVYLMPSALVMLSMAAGLRRRFGLDYAAPFAIAGSVIAGVATMLALGPLGDFGEAWPLTICLAVDAALCAFAGLALRRPGLMYAASILLYLATASMLRASGVPAPQSALVLVAAAIVNVALASKLPEPARAYAQPFAIVALAAGMLPVLAGATASDFYVEHDRPWGIATLLATGALYAIGARVYRQPYLMLLSAASAFGAYALTLHHFGIHDPEFYAAPTGLAILVWSGRRPRDAGQGALGLAAVALLVVPSMARSFDAPGDPQALAALGLGVVTAMAGMVLRRRTALVGGTAAIVAEAVGKAVQFMLETSQPWEVWGMAIGGVLFLLGTSVELLRRRVMDGTVARWRESARARFSHWGW